MHSVHCAGLQKEGAVGLLKGTGRGLVGLIVRPTGGLVDLASGTLSFVSRYKLSSNDSRNLPYIDDIWQILVSFVLKRSCKL